MTYLPDMFTPADEWHDDADAEHDTAMRALDRLSDMAPLRACPKCARAGGLIYCPVCHGPKDRHAPEGADGEGDPQTWGMGGRPAHITAVLGRASGRHPTSFPGEQPHPRVRARYAESPAPSSPGAGAGDGAGPAPHPRRAGTKPSGEPS